MTPFAPFLQMQSVPAAGAAAGGSAASAQSNDVTGFSMTCQQEDFWCWAAVTQAVEQWAGNGVTQSDVASHHIAPGHGLVCATPLSSSSGSGQSCGQCIGTAGGCGDAHFLSKLLDGRGRLAPGGAVNSTATFEDVVDAIDAQRPLPVRINWSDGQGHFVCVSGYKVLGDGRHIVTVHDPLSPGVNGGAVAEIDMDYDDFAQQYAAPSGSNGVPNYYYEVQ